MHKTKKVVSQCNPYLDLHSVTAFFVLSESPLFNNFGYIFFGCSPFPRRTHRVRTAGMLLSQKNLS